MSEAPRTLLVEFADAEAALGAAERLRRDGVRILDALTPFPVPRLAALVGADAALIRPLMAAAGVAVALLFAGLQVYSQAFAYPLNSGGRPLASWQVYMLVPFETGVLAAAAAGFLALLWRSGLPRLHHPLFAVPGIERATQDRFFLILAAPAGTREALSLDRALLAAGALSIGEVGA